MLEYLHVKNLALIRECELNFTKGLNVLTGETGAGKSVLLGSVNLALGAKADKDIIRRGAEEASVELAFSLDEASKRLLESMEISCEDSSVYISRKITPTKNVFKINGEIVPAKQVKELAGGLIDIHGQHEHQSLLLNTRQRDMLDAYGALEIYPVLSSVEKLAKEYSSLSSELEELNEKVKERDREISLLQYECREIEEAALVVGEDEVLEENYRRMTSAEKLLSLSNEALSFISSDTGNDASSLIGRAISDLRKVSSLDESASSFEGQLAEAESIIGDFCVSISSYIDNLEFSEEEFTECEQRLDVINGLKAKFGNSIEKILNYYDEKSKELEKLENIEDYFKTLEGRTAEVLKEYKEKAAELSRLRRKAGEDFAEKLTYELLSLNFTGVVFEVNIDSDENQVSSKGFDSIEFMISTNPGEPIKPMKNVASGGELSRIMLAIKTILAAKDNIDSLIFDEIDAGISGRTAWEVSKKLSGLSKEHQVILITHLAQIAAMGDTHFEIKKEYGEGETLTNISRLNESESVDELARLLGTDEAGIATLTNAFELKEKAKAFKAENE